MAHFHKIFLVDGRSALPSNYLGFCHLFPSPLQGCRFPPPLTIFPGHIPYVYPQGCCPWPKTVSSLFHAHLESITGTQCEELPFMESIYVQCWSVKAQWPLPFIGYDRSCRSIPVWECELRAEFFKVQAHRGSMSWLFFSFLFFTAFSCSDHFLIIMSPCPLGARTAWFCREISYCSPMCQTSPTSSTSKKRTLKSSFELPRAVQVWNI